MTLLKRHRFLQQALAASALTLVLGAAPVYAEQTLQTDAQASVEYMPSEGQSGKDVVWIPTPQTLVDQMLGMAEITPQDYLVDLGSGDGRTVITAALQGTRAHGVEFNPDMVRFAKRAAQEAGVSDRATFVEGDIFETDFSDATVVTLFLLPQLNMRLRPTLLDMKPGTRVVSNSFDMDDWEPDDTVEVGVGCESFCHAYKWIVPAKVQGTWKLDDNATLTLEQKFQKLSGHLVSNGAQHQISEAAMQGAKITFTADGKQYTGQVEGSQITGKDSSGTAWSATRQ